MYIHIITLITYNSNYFSLFHHHSFLVILIALCTYYLQVKYIYIYTIFHTLHQYISSYPFMYFKILNRTTYLYPISHTFSTYYHISQVGYINLILSPFTLTIWYIFISFTYLFHLFIAYYYSYDIWYIIYFLMYVYYILISSFLSLYHFNLLYCLWFYKPLTLSIICNII